MDQVQVEVKTTYVGSYFLFGLFFFRHRVIPQEGSQIMLHIDAYRMSQISARHHQCPAQGLRCLFALRLYRRPQCLDNPSGCQREHEGGVVVLVSRRTIVKVQ